MQCSGSIFFIGWWESTGEGRGIFPGGGGGGGGGGDQIFS